MKMTNLLVLLAVSAIAVAPVIAEQPPLKVGTKVAAPFVMRDDAGEWSGISIDLWRHVADELDLEYTFVERELEGLIRGPEDRTLDVSIAAITMTPEREARIDFTHPYFNSGLGIAVAAKGGGGGVPALVGRLVSIDFLLAVLALAVVLFVVGAAVWLFERRRNEEQFGGSVSEGLGAGFWFSAVTMTTVGYGDKAPRTAAGKVVTLVWMFAGIITISSFTAAIASTLTVERIHSSIRGPEDLAGKTVGAVAGSTGESYLLARSIRLRPYDTPADGLRAVAGGEIDAMVHDAPILRHLARTEFAGAATVLPATFERQGYAAALPLASDLREPVNRLILEFVGSEEWKGVLQRYLGD